MNIGNLTKHAKHVTVLDPHNSAVRDVEIVVKR